MNLKTRIIPNIPNTPNTQRTPINQNSISKGGTPDVGVPPCFFHAVYHCGLHTLVGD